MPGAGPLLSGATYVSSCSSRSSSRESGGSSGCSATATTAAAAGTADFLAVAAEAAVRQTGERCVLNAASTSAVAAVTDVRDVPAAVSDALSVPPLRLHHDQQQRKRQQSEFLAGADVFLCRLHRVLKHGMTGEEPVTWSLADVRRWTEGLRGEPVPSLHHHAVYPPHQQLYNYHDQYRQRQHLERQSRQEAPVSGDDSYDQTMAGQLFHDPLHYPPQHHQQQQQLYHDNNPDNAATFKKYPLPPAFQNGCKVGWTWNMADKSHEVRLCGRRHGTALFHPNWSNGTAGVRGTRPLNGGVHFWEVRVSSRVFGTSMMFGVATARARLHVDAFVNLVGEDREAWGLSHKGLLWHGGRSRVYTAPFRENEATTVGLLFDGLQGTLTFYKDGESLGPAFSGLDGVQGDIFPVVCSTAAKTEMTLGMRRRAFLSLQDRCRAVVVRSLCGQKKVSAVNKLPLPNPMRQYIREEAIASAL